MCPYDLHNGGTTHRSRHDGRGLLFFDILYRPQISADCAPMRVLGRFFGRSHSLKSPIDHHVDRSAVGI
jgi:hypothetical protein